MADKYREYPEYKDSGVEWLDKVPEHWEVKKLKYIANIFPSNVDKKTKREELPVQLCNYTDVYYNDVIRASDNFMKASATEEQIKKFTLLAGDTIVTKDSEDAEDIAIPAFVPKDIDGVVCGYHLSLIRPYEEKYGALIKRNFEATYVRAYMGTRANGLTRYGLGTYALSNTFFVQPPPQEVTDIVNFLDHETAKIDTLIEKQQQLIALLKEKRQAVISHAVTKGLNPDATMKDSGVEWLGEVPAHWEVTYLTHLVPDNRKIMYGIVLPGPDVEIGVPIVKGGDVKPGRLNLESLCKTTFEIELNYERSRLERGDLVYSIRGTIGDVEIVPNEIEGANLTQDAARISPKEGINNEWLKYAMESTAIFSQLELGSLGAAVKGINIRDLKKAVLPKPPANEMNEIAEYLNHILGKLSTLSMKCDNQINLLQERRTALISAAVTGKIDVRNWQPPADKDIQ